MPGQPDIIAEFRDVHRHYVMGDNVVKALAGVSLQVHRGDYLAIMGRSGSGKSTMLNILGCLDRPTSGQYLVGGKDVSQLSDDELSDVRGRDIGFIFQSFNLIPQLTVLENVAVPRLYHPHDGASSEARCRELLDAVGLSHRLGHLPNQLSGGERQRVAIARALVNDPVMLLADEPTGNLDTATGEDVLALMHELHAQGRTIVMITHDEEIARGAGRQVHIRDGVILEEAAA
jgi:putative ABC transport system ATP-binding protein